MRAMSCSASVRLDAAETRRLAAIAVDASAKQQRSRKNRLVINSSEHRLQACDPLLLRFGQAGDVAAKPVELQLDVILLEVPVRAQRGGAGFVAGDAAGGIEGDLQILAPHFDRTELDLRVIADAASRAGEDVVFGRSQWRGIDAEV